MDLIVYANLEPDVEQPTPPRKRQRLDEGDDGGAGGPSMSNSGALVLRAELRVLNRHPKFYFADGDCVIRVEDTLFRVRNRKAISVAWLTMRHLVRRCTGFCLAETRPRSRTCSASRTAEKTWVTRLKGPRMTLPSSSKTSVWRDSASYCPCSMLCEYPCLPG